MKNWIIATLAAGLALAIGAVALSQNTRTANVEVRVWQKMDDDRALYVSARSGTTVRVAEALGRRGLGFDLSPTYLAAATAS